MQKYFKFYISIPGSDIEWALYNQNMVFLLRLIIPQGGLKIYIKKNNNFIYLHKDSLWLFLVFYLEGFHIELKCHLNKTNNLKINLQKEKNHLLSLGFKIMNVIFWSRSFCMALKSLFLLHFLKKTLTIKYLLKCKVLNVYF